MGKYRTGFRNNTTRAGTTPATDWRNYPTALADVAERMVGVTVEHRPAIDLLSIFDGPETLFYCDPPYPYSTRNARHAGNVYRHEMTDDDHRTLAAALHDCAGMVVISGYACELYDRELFADWQRVERATHGDGARDRIEVLWIKPNTFIAQPALFNHQEAA